MKRGTVDRIAAVAYALVDFIVIMAPSLAIKLAADRGGMGSTKGLDLVVASLVLATGHAIIAGRRLRYEERTAVWRADIWIASFNALVVLALTTTLLLLVGLRAFPSEHASLAERGYPVVALWVGLQLTAIVFAELVGRGVFWWLEPHRARGPRAVARGRALSRSAQRQAQASSSDSRRPPSGTRRQGTRQV